ncbi:MAG TPA: hypothetical protein VFW00_07235, partial [Rhodocyclaceae bacterium]|nr:hypothetical protein [Rhodocyclaceae bacterium]
AWPEEGFPHPYAKIGKNSYWRPLDDDGDALRLAVDLGIYFMVVRDQGHVSARIWNGSRTFLNENLSQGEYAATRRAIVRAAAEVGRRK